MPSSASVRLAGILLSLASSISASAQASPGRDTISTHDVRCSICLNVKPLTTNEKAERYADQTFSLKALLGASYAAGIAQWRKSPPEWGSGISGFGRREAAAYGGSLIGRTAEFGVGALLHEDPRFEPSARSGFMARSEDAVYHALMVRADDGGRQPAISHLAAAVATGFAVNSWEPKRLHSPHHALLLSLAGVAGYVTGSVTREFSPDVKRFLLGKLHIRDRW